MSNYTPTANFTALTTAHAIINGAALDVEYGNIATAIASKIDAASVGESVGNLSVTSATLPANGLYLPAGNQVGIAANTTAVALFGPGVQFGTPTGGDKGAGTLNSTGLYIHGAPVITTTVVLKPSTTSRNTTTTLTADPGLVTSTMATGYYLVNISLLWQAAAGGGANGVKWALTFSGTCDGTSFVALLPNASALAQSFQMGSGLYVSNNNALATPPFIDNHTVTSFLLHVTVSGTLGVSWAQVFSGAQNLSLLINSAITYSKIAP